MIVAYLRVSTGKQLLENQKNEISAFAQNRNMVIDQWVTEIASGCKQRNDRKLGTLLRRMKKGDSLIVTELSRLSRTLIDIMTIMGTLLQKGVVLYSTKNVTVSTTRSTARYSASLSGLLPKSNAI